MKKIPVQKYRHEMDIVRLITRGFMVIALLFLLLPVFGGCGGGDAGSSTNATPTSVTDTSGDFAITVSVESSSQIIVSWESPTNQYSLRPEYAYSRIYRDGAKIVPSTGDFYYTDAGLLPQTTHCYRVEVIAVYQYFFPGSYITVRWSSGTACIATLPDTTAPFVTSSTPENSAANVPINSIIQVTFSESVDPLTVNTSSFVVSGPAGTVPGTIAVSSATATFTPGIFLTYASTYTATITTGIRDLAGNAMADAFSWSFSTPGGPVTEVATNVKDVSATLNGRFENAAGDTTTVWFEYGTTIAYGSSTTPAYYAAAGTIPFSADVSGLPGWSTYHYRIVVKNTAGTYYGNDRSFKTYMIPEILSSGLNAPLDIHLDSGNVYWVEIYSDAVKSVPVAGGTTSVVATSAMWGNQASLALDASYVYWADESTIWKKDRIRGTVTVVASKRPYIYITCLRVQSTDLYFGSDNGIEKVDLDTGAIETVVSAKPWGGLAIDTTNIYWSSGGSIAKIARAGGPIVTLAVGLNEAHSLLLDSGYLYWAEKTAIKKMIASGGKVTTIAANVSPWEIAKDDTDVYWTDHYGGTINTVGLGGGIVTTLVVGQWGGAWEGPMSIAVDANSVYWIVPGSSYYPPMGEIRKASKIY